MIRTAHHHQTLHHSSCCLFECTSASSAPPSAAYWFNRGQLPPAGRPGSKSLPSSSTNFWMCNNGVSAIRGYHWCLAILTCVSPLLFSPDFHWPLYHNIPACREKHYHIRILFDGTWFTQITNCGILLPSFFSTSRLNCDNAMIGTCNSFASPLRSRDILLISLLTVAVAVCAAHQLECLSEDHRYYVCFTASHLALNSKYSAAGVINEDGGFTEFFDAAFVKLFHFMFFQFTTGIFFRHFTFGTEYTLYKLAAHLEAKETYSCWFGGMHGWTGRFSANAVLPTDGLAARMIRSVGLPAISNPVQWIEPSRYTGDIFCRLRISSIRWMVFTNTHLCCRSSCEGDCWLFQTICFLRHQAYQTHLYCLHKLPNDLTADTYQLTLYEFLKNDAAMRFYIRSRYNCIGEFGNIVRTTTKIQFFTNL